MDTIVSTKQNEIVKPIDKMLHYNGRYGEYGGAYIPEVLAKPLDRLSSEFERLSKDSNFQDEFVYLLKQYVGRPSPLYRASRLSEYVGSSIYLKREI